MHIILHETIEGSIPVCCRPFPFARRSFNEGGFDESAFAYATADAGSTGSKQTLNGLFYVYRQSSFLSLSLI
jgi:hypothetical protein